MKNDITHLLSKNRCFVLSILLFFIHHNCFALNEYKISPVEPDLIGELVLTETIFEDTLSDLARAYDQGYNEIKLANPAIDPWLPGEGTEIMIPSFFVLPETQKQGIVINVAEMRMYLKMRRLVNLLYRLSQLASVVSIGGRLKEG